MAEERRNWCGQNVAVKIQVYLISAVFLKHSPTDRKKPALSSK